MVDVSSAGDAQLRAEVAALGRTQLNKLCAILGLQDSGPQSTLRTSVLSLLGGPPSRRRRNWLRLGLRVAVTADKGPEDELDDDSLSAFGIAGGELLLDLHQRLGAFVNLTEFLPVSVLPDILLSISEDDDDAPWVFSLPATFSFVTP